MIDVFLADSASTANITDRVDLYPHPLQYCVISQMKKNFYSLAMFNDEVITSCYFLHMHVSLTASK